MARFSWAPSERPIPVLFGDILLVVTASGSIQAVEAATGEFAWKLGLPGERLLRPVALPDLPDRILVASSKGHLLVLDREMGAIRDELDLGMEVSLPPSVEGSELVLTTPSGDVVSYDLAARRERWRTATGEEALALSRLGDLVVVSGGLQTLTALDARDGAVRWKLIGRGPFRAAATIGGNGRVYAGDDLGEFYSLGAEDGKVKFRWSTGGAIRTSPLLEADRVLVATLGNNLYAYEAGGGDELWRSSLPGRPFFGPVHLHVRLLVVTLDGAFVEMHPERGRLDKSWVAPGELAQPPSFRMEPKPLLSIAPSQPATDPGEHEADAAAEPPWFERSRVAVALRTGDVLLLKHQLPVAPPPTESPDESEGAQGGPPAETRPPPP